MRVPRDHDFFDTTVAYDGRELIFYDLPHFEKPAVRVPAVGHVTIGLSREIKVVFPVRRAVAPFKQDKQGIAVLLICVRSRLFL